ncbi:MAG: HAD-IB family phosphatase [Candidatus Eisenbacteria bacterium]
MSARTLWLCDFDGTIAPWDIGAALIERFAPDAGGRRQVLLERWKREEIGSLELTREECRDVRVEPAAALEFVRGFEIDPGFAGFVGRARARGDEVQVVSDGFDFYIGDLLSRAGLADVPYVANRARFENGGLVPEFPHSGGCGRCGNCKAAHARRGRERGFRIAAVGNGYSDRCMVREADSVFARGSLLDWCRHEALAVTPFNGFAALAGPAFGPPAGVPA